MSQADPVKNDITWRRSILNAGKAVDDAEVNVRRAFSLTSKNSNDYRLLLEALGFNKNDDIDITTLQQIASFRLDKASAAFSMLQSLMDRINQLRDRIIASISGR